ncbi:RIP metalloprotease RseP [Fictibacillus sp. WQ 8-8]|uniref:RIP metalloprotease RseP n=1 Tax=unclassified Fictibacillus TaxID=2644029 RepID=UPI0006A7E8F8|nr:MULTISPECIES: RIP metalloprotease RseP [unclassified Fictibacillus]MCQ6265827.1 RIP metalloprotease RseP [Fictibacillus sp. WQ 8-8]MED2973291.1 RIP metalloprotease RseP [Fictibacillus sp. B-59209]UZJ77136.1 RIP metalloprotease RseP [Fictibacillus sp. KU28468]SFD88275.1 regulator of sigma E protease [Bacillus sp. OV194]
MNTVIAIVIILGALVFFHELGHLLLAKRAGILCREFAIGFGPKIFAFKKNETTYTVRLLPLGGFVRMAGEDPEGIELKPGYRVGLIFNPEGNVQKIIVNHKEKYEIQKVITVESADLERDLIIRGFENEEGERLIYKVDPQAMYAADHQEMQIAPYDRQFGSKTLMQRTLAIFAGPFMNVLLAFIVLMSFSLFQGIPTKEARLGNLAPDGAAIKSGLQKGDKIVSVNGDKVSNWEELVSFIQQNPGEELTFEIDRNGQTLKKPVTPGERDMDNKGNKEGFIGAYPSTEFSLLGSVSYGAKQTWFMTKMIFIGLGDLITGKHGFDQLSGPVGIYEYTNKATEGGIPMLLQWAAVLSINLAIFNLLPLPALDGGRLLFLALEALRGKPIDPQKEGLVHFIGFAFLMLLMLVVTWNDIHKFFLDKIDQ